MSLKKELNFSDIRYLFDILPYNIINIDYNYNNKHSIITLNKFSSNLFELYIFKKHQFFKYNLLIDIFAVDFLNYKREQKSRFAIFYNFLSLRYNKRLILKIDINQTNSIDSITNLYFGANWLEREIWDLFGIKFKNNKDLRRILTDYGFLGHALKKDFPLAGFIEVRYDDQLRSIVYEKVELSQEFRLFDFRSPWNKEQK